MLKVGLLRGNSVAQVLIRFVWKRTELAGAVIQKLYNRRKFSNCWQP